MATGFNLQANVILSAANVRPIVSQIQRQLQGIRADVNIQLPKSALTQVASLNSQLQNLNQNLNNINKNSGAASLNKLGSSMGNVAKQAQSAKSASYELGEAIGQAARKFGTFSAAAGAMTALALAIKNGVSSAINFQHQMVRLQQVGNGTREGISDIASEITKLSTALGTSSSELSKVAVTLRQAGLSAKDTKDALSAIASTSVAPTFNDIENSVEGAIAVMQQFNVKANELKNVFGSINRVSADFAVEADDIVHAIRRSGGAFKAAGGNLNELIALFTSVRQTTRESAETIASGFNTISARLQRPQAVEQLRLMGIELRNTAAEAKAFGKTEGEFVGMYEAIKRLNEALKNVPTGSPEFAAIVEQIGGFRQVSKVIPLLQQFTVTEKAMGSALYGQTSLVRSNILAQQSLTVQVHKLQEEFLNLFRVLGSNKTLNAFAQGFLSLATGAVKLAASLEPLIPLITTLATVKLVSTLGQFTTPGFVSGVKSGLGKNRPFASGGLVPGVGDQDSVAARLTPGEFVLRKSAVKAIGSENLHAMNKGGVATQYFDDGGEARKANKIVVGNPDFNRAYIKPPGGEVGMLVTGTRKSLGAVTHPILPVSLLKGNSLKQFKNDKDKLVGSGALTQDQADQITSLTTPVKVLGVNQQKASAVKSDIYTGIINLLNGLSSHFDAPTAGITIPKTESKRIFDETIGANGTGRIFEGFLKTVASKTGGDKTVRGPGEKFDFDPVTGTGLSGLFGTDINGLVADAKLNDNYYSRASVVSKALRKYGIANDINLQKLSKSYDIRKYSSKKDKTTGTNIRTSQIVQVDPLAYARKKLSSQKLASGGVVQHFGAGDEVLNQDQYFPIHDDIPQGISGKLSSVLLSNPNFKFANDAIEKLLSKGRTRGAIKSNIKRRDEFSSTKTGPHTLKIPFDGDIGLGVIGKHNLGSAGNVTAERSVSNILAETKSKEVGVDLKKLGIDKVNMAYTRHIVSQNITGDFDKTLRGPVSGAIKKAFTSRFGDIVSDLHLQRSELASLEGVLFEKYISGVTKTVLGKSKGGKDPIFDFPHGFPANSSINTVVRPKVLPTDRIDAKLDLSQARVEHSLAGKYLSYNVGKLGLLAGRAVKQEPQSEEYLGIKQKYDTLQPKVQNLAKLAKSDPAKYQNTYYNLLDYSIALKHQLATRDNTLDNAPPPGYKKYASGGMVPYSKDINDTYFGDAYGRMAKGPHADALSSHLPEGSKLLSHGTDAVVFDTGDGNVVRIGGVGGEGQYRHDTAKNRPAHPMMLQALSRHEVGPYVVEKLPKVTPLGDIQNRSRRMNFIQQAFKNRLKKKYNRDILRGELHPGNLTRHNKRIIGLDPELFSDPNSPNSFSGTPTKLPSTTHYQHDAGEKVKATAKHYATGGTADTVPAMVMPGEFIFSRESAQRIGYSKLHAMNKYAKGGVVKHFADGGTYDVLGIQNAAQGRGYPIAAGHYEDTINGIRGLNNRHPNEIITLLRQILATLRKKDFGGGKSAGNISSGNDKDSEEQVGKFANLKRFGGIAAVAAAQYAPAAIEHFTGTLDTAGTDPNKRQRAQFGAAAGSALAYGATGAAIGSAIPVIGTALGALAGAAYGLVTSFEESSKQIREIDFAKDMKNFSNTIQRATADNEAISAGDTAKIRAGIDKITKEASLNPDKDTFFAEKVDVGPLQAFLSKVASGSGIKATDTEDIQRSKILEAQGGAGRDVVSLLRQLPEFKEQNLEQILAPFAKIGATADRDKTRETQLAAFESSVKRQIHSFSQLGVAVDRAAAHLEELNTSLDVTIGIGEGNFKTPQVSQFSRAAAGFGTSSISPAQFNKSIDFITGPAKSFGGKLTEDFSSSAKDAHAVLAKFPEILGSLLHKGINEDTLGKKLEDSILEFVPKADQNVTNKLKAAATEGFTPAELLKKIGDDLPGLIEDITKKAFSGIGEIASGAAKKLEDNLNNYSASIAKYQELQVKLGEAQDRYVDLQLELSESVKSIVGRRVGLTPTLNPEERNIPFNLRQSRLTGFRSGAALDPNAITNKFNAVSGQIRDTLAKKNSLSAGDYEGIQAVDAKLQDLGSSAARLQTALQHLADPVQRNAALQERLNQLNEESAQRQSLAERYYVAAPQERAKIDQAANAANAVATGSISADVLPQGLKEAVFSLSHDLEEIPTAIFGGLKGKDFRQQFLSQHPLTQQIANLPGGREAERRGLEGGIVDNIKVAIESQAKLAGIIENTQKSFFTELQSNQKAFLDEFRKGLLESNLSESQGRLTSAQARSETLTKTQDAGNLLESAGLGDFNKGRRLVRDPEFSALAANVKKQSDLENTLNSGSFSPTIDQNELNKANHTIPGHFFTNDYGMQGYQFEKNGFDPKVILENFQKKLGGLQGSGKVSGNEIEEFLKKFKASIESSEFVPTTENINKTAQDILSQTLIAQKEQTAATIKVQTESVKNTHNLGSSSDTLYLARNQTQIENSLGVVKDYTDVNSLNKAAKIASDGLEGLAIGVGILKAQLDKLTKGDQSSTIANNAIGAALEGTGITPQPQHFAKGGLVEKKLSQLFRAKGTDTIPAMLTKGEAVVPASSTQANSGLVNKLINAKGPLYAADGFDPGADDDPFDKTSRFFSVNPFTALGVPVAKAIINYRVKPALYAAVNYGNLFAEGLGNLTSNSENTNPLPDQPPAPAITSVASDLRRSSYDELVRQRAKTAIFNRNRLSPSFSAGGFDSQSAADSGTSLVADQLEEQRKALNTQISTGGRSLFDRKRTSDDVTAFNQSDIAKRANAILHPTQQTQPITNSLVTESPISSPADVSAAPDNSSIQRLLDNPRISEAVRNRLIANQARQTSQVDNQTLRINQQKAIAAKRAAISNAGIASRREDFPIYDIEQSPNQRTLFAKKQQADALLNQSNAQRKIEVTNRILGNTDFNKLSRRQKGNISHVNSLLSQYSGASSGDLAGSDLQQAANIHHYFNKELSRKGLGDKERTLLQNKQNEFRSSTLAKTFFDEQSRRGANNQINPEGLYKNESGQYKSIRSVGNRLTSQSLYEQNISAIQNPLLSQLSPADLSKEKSRKSLTLAERKKAIKSNGTSLEIHRNLESHGHPEVATQHPIEDPVLRHFEEEKRKKHFEDLEKAGPSGIIHGYTRGGQTNQDDRLIAVNGNEFVMNADATSKHLQLLKNMNSGKGLTYKAGGGLASGANVISSGGTSSGSTMQLSSESITALSGFNSAFAQSVAQMSEPLRSFGEAVTGMSSVVTGVQQLVGPLNVFSQNIQMIKTPFDGFNTSATDLAAGMALFNKNATILATAMSSLANLPSTITVQGTTQVNVAFTGAEAFMAMKAQIVEETIAAVSAKLKPEIISSIKSGQVAG